MEEKEYLALEITDAPKKRYVLNGYRKKTESNRKIKELLCLYFRLLSVTYIFVIKGRLWSVFGK